MLQQQLADLQNQLPKYSATNFQVILLLINGWSIC